MKIVCLGDSLTYGYGVKRSQVWTYLIQEKYGVKIVNKGINGDTTGGMLGRFCYDVVENRPSHVMIMGGGNDLMMNIPLPIVQANMATMVYQAYGKKIRPIIGTGILIEPTMAKKYWDSSADYERVNREGEKLREWILDFSGKNNIPVVDFCKEFEKIIEGKNKDAYYTDGLHLNPKGQEIMANMVNLGQLLK